MEKKGAWEREAEKGERIKPFRVAKKVRKGRIFVSFLSLCVVRGGRKVRSVCMCACV